MKNMNKMKRFGAAVTAAMMLGSLNAAVFADEDVTEEIPEAPAVTEPAPVEEPVIEAPVLEDETTEAPAEEVTEPAEEEAPTVEEEAPVAEEVPAEEAEGDVSLAAGGDGNVLVKDSANDSEITITGAKASLKDGIYTVTVQYAFSGVTPVEKSQIAMLGYIFDTTAENASDVTVVEGNIRAVDQDVATKGSFKFNLAKGDGTNMTVSDTAKMVVKLGANVEGVNKAQAFFIDLSLASEGGEEIVYGDVNNDGEVDGADALIVAKYDAGLPGFDTLANMDAADVNGDGEVDGADSLIIAKYDAGLPGFDSLPVK